MILSQYLWILIVTTIFALISAFGIGANDLANSFASSVGARALSMPMAILIAAVCEFGGAVLLGASVTDTVRSKIARISYFEKTPDLLMFGMMCVVLAAGFWDNFACHMELPVSTTHTTVGAVVGMALAIKGNGAVVWSAHKSTFPYVDGMVPVFLSWIVSPVVSGIIATIIFGLLRTFVLRSKDGLKRAMIVFPILVGGTFYLITSFILQTGNKNNTWKRQLNDGTIAWIGAVICGITFLLATALVFYFRKRIIADEIRDEREASARAAAQAEAQNAAKDGKGNPIDGEILAPTPVEDNTWWGRQKRKPGVAKIWGHSATRALTYGSRYKVHDVIQEDHVVAQLWETAEVFDSKTESLFKYLQVFTACVMSFAHGSNDIANAMGPFSAVYAIYQTGAVPAKSPVPVWILAIGGAGIVTGLATYGYKIMRVLGVKSVKLTNSRGFCVELSTALTVVLASRFGLPVSTTQVLTGAILAVGLFEGAKGVNWRMFAKIFSGWVLTLFVAGFVAAAFSAFGVYSPNRFASEYFATVDGSSVMGNHTLRGL